MILTVSLVICVTFSNIAVSNGQRLQPALVKQMHDVFNNFSNLALLPDLMQTPECRRDCQLYYEALFQNEIWASEMYDAGGKTIPGILTGALFQLANVDECIGGDSATSKIDRKFCLVKIYLEAKHENIVLRQLLDKVKETSLFTTKQYDNSVFPSNLAFLASLCVPSSCTVSEVEIASRKILSIFNESQFQIEAHLDNISPLNCMTTNEYTNESSLLYIIKIVLVVKIVFVCLATLLDAWMMQNIDSESEDMVILLVKSYSLKRNGQILFNVENENGSLTSLNGLRCTAYFFMFITHYCARLLLFTVNRVHFYELLRSPYLVPLWKNTVTVLDLMSFLSGICHSYKLSKLAMQDKRRTMFKLLFFRYLRLLLFITAFAFFAAPNAIKSKFFLLYTPNKRDVDIWSVVFCYENFYGVHNMFFGPLHTFYTDIQLYAIACITLLAIKSLKNKTSAFLSMILATLLCRSIIIYFRTDITGFLALGITCDQLMEMFTLMYGTPLGRFPLYLSGIALGYYVRQNAEKYSNLSSFHIKTGWTIASLCLSVVFLSYCMTAGDYVYNSFHGAVLTFMHTSSLVIFLSWLVWYCCEFKNSGIAKFLSANTFVVLNRLIPYFSILHILTLMYSLTDRNSPFEFSWTALLGLDYLFLTLLACMFVMLFIDLPTRNFLKNVCYKKEKEIKTD